MSSRDLAAGPGTASDGASPPTCFTCTRLNDTTFLVVEDDQWKEYPFIYVKIYQSTMVLIDTGCGGSVSDGTDKLTSLREFLETYPVSDNGNAALNPGSEKAYIVICSHCHFDHIGAIAQFTDAPKSTIWASSFDRSFIEGDGRLPTSSLCRFVGMETPEYKVSHWADDGERMAIRDSQEDQNPVIYHAPGHTPDELAIWDPLERVLFVGDTLYEWVPIVFPLEGDLKLYSKTIGRLKTLVQEWNTAEPGEGNDDASRPARVKVACGHVTSAEDAENLIGEVDYFLYQVVENMIEPKSKGTFRDEPLISYEREDGRISFLGPQKVFDGFRADATAMRGIQDRHL